MLVTVANRVDAQIEVTLWVVGTRDGGSEG